jgi:predicted nuclease of restriction endonuclease-like (RecB) superfamily
VNDVPDLPEGYGAFVEQLKRLVRTARLRATRVVNTELLLLTGISAAPSSISRLPRGTKVVDRLAADLRAEFPKMRGFSRSNLHYMRRIADAWPRSAYVQRAVGQLQWGHVTTLVDRLDNQVTRDWYSAAAVDRGWSREVLVHRIRNQLDRRVGSAPSNFNDHRTQRPASG